MTYWQWEKSIDVITVGEIRKRLGSFHDDENIPDTQECIAKVEGGIIIWAIAFIQGGKDNSIIHPRSKYQLGYEQEVNQVIEKCREDLGAVRSGKVELILKG